MSNLSAAKIRATSIVGDYAWTEKALCSDKTELFFEPPGERPGRRQRREATARSYCAVCPVQQACLISGRENRENGIWGGENDEERALAGFAPRAVFRRDVAQARLHGIRLQTERDELSILHEQAG